MRSPFYSGRPDIEIRRYLSGPLRVKLIIVGHPIWDSPAAVEVPPAEWVLVWEVEREKAATAQASVQGPETAESAQVWARERVESAVAVAGRPP